MKLAIEFPAISYREGPAKIADMARGIEEIGYDHIDIYDHVIMGYNIPGRDKSYYSPKMPVLEAVATLSYAAAVTSRVTLGTEVLVLPQRHPKLPLSAEGREVGETPRELYGEVSRPVSTCQRDLKASFLAQCDLGDATTFKVCSELNGLVVRA